MRNRDERQALTLLKANAGNPTFEVQFDTSEEYTSVVDALESLGCKIEKLDGENRARITDPEFV